jgi:hypothetical protein
LIRFFFSSAGRAWNSLKMALAPTPISADRGKLCHGLVRDLEHQHAAAGAGCVLLLLVLFS